jgi:hypothetical protein
LFCHVEEDVWWLDGSTKEDLMDYGDILANCLGCEENGKEVLVLKAVDDYSWGYFG